MHFSKFTILALVGLVAAIPAPNGGGGGGGNNGDSTSTSCSGSQSTVCCDKAGKNCEIKNSCNNEQVIMCGNILGGVLGRDLAKMVRRNGGGGGGGDNTATSCAGGQSAMCCNKAGKDCSISSSCSNSQTIFCGNILDTSGLLGKRNGGGGGGNGGDNTATSCAGSQSTACCDDAKKNCEIKDSCSNTQTIFCGNTVTVPVTTDLGSILRRTNGGGGNNNGGDNTSTSCSGSQSTMCCDKAGKNCSIKDSCNNQQVIICGNSVTVPVNIDTSSVTDLLSGGS